MGLDVKGLLSIGGISREEFHEFAVLADQYFDVRRAGKLGLKQEDVEEHLVEVLITCFTYDAASGHYMHHGIESLMNDMGTRGRADGQFEDFWKVFPRKVGKLNARKAWSKHVRTTERGNKIIAALKRQLEVNNWAQELSYCPHASTWLNGERWEDEINAGFPAAVRVDA